MELGLTKARLAAVVSVALIGLLVAPQWLYGAPTVQAEGIVVVNGTLPSDRELTSAAFDGTFAYIVGGKEGGKRLDQIVRYDPAADTSTVLSAKLPSGRESTASVWHDGKLYIIGGKDSGQRRAEIFSYDPSTGVLSLMKSRLPTGREEVGAASVGDHIYILGGNDGGAVASILRFDPRADSIQTMMARLPSARDSISTATDGRSIWLFGGRNGAILDQIVQYEPGRDQVTVMDARLPTPRESTAAFFDGRFAYVAGGRDANGRLAELLRYDPIADTIIPVAASLPEGREFMSAVFDGDAGYLFGGRGSGHRMNQILKYDIATGAPQNLAASSGPEAGQISLSWQAPDPADFETPIVSYRLYRGFYSGSATYLTDIPADQTTYVDTGLPNGVARYYRISAQSNEGEGGLSNEAYANTYDGEPPPLPSPRENTNSAIVGGKIFVFGGQQQAGSTTPSLSGATDQESADPGTMPVEEIVRYDPETGEVTVLGVALPPKCCAAAIATDLYVYLFGGDGEDKCCEQQDSAGVQELEPDGVSDDIFRFDPISETITQIEAELNDPKCCFSGFYTGDYIYLFGGDDGTPKCCEAATDAAAPTGDILRFDPITETIETLGGDMVPPKCCFEAVWAGTYGYLFGGSDDADDKCCDANTDGVAGASTNSLMDDILRFDPVTETLTKIEEELPVGKCCLSAVFTDAVILLFGGEDADKCCMDAVGARGGMLEEDTFKSDDILVFDPVTEQVRVLGDRLPTGRSSTSAVWDGDTAYVFGGDDGEKSLAQVVGYHPGAPEGVTARAGPDAGQITVSWDPPVDGSAAHSTGYRIYAGDASGQLTLVASVPIDQETYNETDLGDGRSRYYRVSVFDAINQGPQSPETTARTWTVPSAPQNLAAEITNLGEVTLTWEAPNDDGGSALIEYVVRRATDRSPEVDYATVPADTLTYVDRDCDLGAVTCTYSVLARNIRGRGPESNDANALGTGLPVLSLPYTPSTPAHAPSGPTPWSLPELRAV